MADADFINQDFLNAISAGGDKAEQRIYTELRRRKRSKKARQRLVRSILKRGHDANQGAFAREVCEILGLRKLAKMSGAFLRDKLEQPSFTRQIFAVQEPMTPEEKAVIQRAYAAEQAMAATQEKKP
jgi:hypothetical protein